MTISAKLTGGTIYLVSFMTHSNKKIDRFVTIEDPLPYGQINKAMLAQFSTIKEIIHVDQWDDTFIIK